MAKPSDEYDPTSNVSPSVASPGNTLSVQATPNAFGAQIGQANQRMGDTLNKIGDQAAALAIQRQGQINETLATQADMDLTVRGGEIYNKYKNLTGLDAVAARGQAIQDYMGLHDDIRAKLPSDAARRSFDQVATRSTAYTVRDIDSYAAGQQKQAHTTALTASAGLALDSISRPTVALDDSAFGYAIGTMKSQLLGAFTNDQGFASVTHLNEKTGEVTFDATPQGHDAEASWTSYYNKYLGKAWENRIDVLAFDPVHGNVTAAVNSLEANRDRMPADAYARLSAKLAGPYKNAQMGQLAVGAVQQAEAGWSNTITGSATTILGDHTPATISADPTKAFSEMLGVPVVIPLRGGPRTPSQNVAVGGVPNSEHLTGNAWDITPQGMPSRDAALQLAQKLTAQGIKFDQIIDEHGDVHVGFGPANRGQVLDRSGAPGAWKYSNVPLPNARVPDVPGGPTGGQTYINKGDYIESNLGTILKDTYEQAQVRFPDRPDLWDQASRIAETQLLNIVRTQRLSVKAEGDSILDAAVNGTYSHGTPLTDITQLDSIPQLADKWRDYQLQAGQFGAATIQRIIQSNARGQASTYGTNFYGTLSKVMSGQYGSIDQVAGDLNVTVDPKHQPLTNTGFKVIRQIMDDAGKDPNTKAFYNQAYNWINGPAVRGSFTMTGTIPGAHTPELDAKFESALMTVMPRLIQGQRQGLTLQQLTDPKSKDYVGGAFDHARPTQADIMKAQLRAALQVQPTTGTPITGTAGAPNTPFDVGSIKSKDDLFKAAKDGKINRQQFDQLAYTLGLVPQPIPTPH